MSVEFKEKAEELGGYRLDYRGLTEVKGKGKLDTWWLVGKDGLDIDLPEPLDNPLYGE